MGSTTVPVMGMAATWWAAVRVFVAPAGDEAVVVWGGGGGGEGCVPPTHNAGRAALAIAPRPSSGLMSFCDAGKGVLEARGDRVGPSTCMIEEENEGCPGMLDETEPGQEPDRCVLAKHFGPPDRGTIIDVWPPELCL